MLWDEPKIFFLERRYFFSIILSEFLKNRVALQRAFRLFSKHTRELTKLALPEDLDASMARCYQDQYGAYRLLLQKGKKLLSVTLWWPSSAAFPAGQIARTLLESME